MKLWRKEAMKEGKQNGARPGRRIKNAAQMQEMMFRRLPKSHPLLNALFKRAGISTPPSFTVTPTPAAEVKEQTNEAV